MSEVGRILSQAGRDVGGAIGGIGETALETVIRIEQLRQQEQRSQIDLFALMQRGRISALQLANEAERIGVLGAQVTQRGEEWTAEEPLRAAKLTRAEAEADIFKARAALGPEKLPTASETGYARRRREFFIKEIEGITAKIDHLRRTLKLAPGEEPKEPAWPWKGKEQIALDNWNKLHRDLATSQDALDRLLRESEARGIDLGYGARVPLPTPEEMLDKTDEEILQTLGTVGR